MKDIESLISVFREKFENSKLHVSPLFHRLNQYHSKNKVDEVNTKLKQFASSNVYILRNPYLNKWNRYCFSEGVHFTPLGTSELAKMIKNNLNEHLELESYSNYETNQGPHGDQYQGYQDPFYNQNPQTRSPTNKLSPNERNILMRLLNL